MNPTTLVLASASPRRIAIFNQLHLDFITCPAPINETIDAQLDIRTQTLRLSAAKCRWAEQKLAGQYRWFCGFDTLGMLDDSRVPQEILAKPKDRQEAAHMLSRLSGRAHFIVTGITLADAATATQLQDYCVTKVVFNEISPAERERYLASGEWRNAAAAYRIQERGSLFVREIGGLHSNVAGLPISFFYGMLKTLKYPFWGDDE